MNGHNYAQPHRWDGPFSLTIASLLVISSIAFPACARLTTAEGIVCLCLGGGGGAWAIMYGTMVAMLRELSKKVEVMISGSHVDKNIQTRDRQRYDSIRNFAHSQRVQALSYMATIAFILVGVASAVLTHRQGASNLMVGIQVICGIYIASYFALVSWMTVNLRSLIAKIDDLEEKVNQMG